MRRQRSTLGEPFDLGDDHSAVVVGGKRLIEDAERGAFVFRGEVAELVRGRCPDDRDVDRDGPEVQPFPAIEVDHFDDLLGGPGVHATAIPARVHEGVLADFGENTRLPDRRRAMQLEQDPRRDVVGLDRAVLDQRHDLRRRRG
jgi:hypothetical protein